jgi:menaquinone-9 beta-reductase
MRPSQHDVIIVGGGPAGLSTALHLVAQRPDLVGRIAVLEKGRYPREKFCAGALSARAELDLGSIGVVVEVPSVPVTTIRARMPRGEVHGTDAPIGRVVRRLEFDAKLAQIAIDRGIRLHQGVTVTGLRLGPDAVEVQLDSREDGTHTLRGSVLVGADGVGSIVRRKLGLVRAGSSSASGPHAGATWRAQVLEVDTPVTDLDGPRDTLLFDVQDRSFNGYEWDFPTLVDGVPMVCRGIYHLALPGERFGEGAAAVDLNARLGKRLAYFGLDLGACKKKRFAERGFASHEPFAAQRTLLVGEAAGIDPITGEGIAQALLYGHHAADFLAERLPSSARSSAVPALDDWPSHLQRTSLGIDLALRSHLARRFFGPGRAFFEDALVAFPEFMDLGVRYFGGRPLSPLAMGRLGLRAAAHALRERDRTPFAVLPIPYN